MPLQVAIRPFFFPSSPIASDYVNIPSRYAGKGCIHLSVGGAPAGNDLARMYEEARDLAEAAGARVLAADAPASDWDLR